MKREALCLSASLEHRLIFEDKNYSGHDPQCSAFVPTLTVASFCPSLATCRSLDCEGRLMRAGCPRCAPGELGSWQPLRLWPGRAGARLVPEEEQDSLSSRPRVALALVLNRGGVPGHPTGGELFSSTACQRPRAERLHSAHLPASDLCDMFDPCPSPHSSPPPPQPPF